MLLLGLHPGEYFGLTWDDIDFKKNKVTVRGNLRRNGTIGRVKTKKHGQVGRVLDIPASVVPTLKARQKAQQAEEKAAAEYLDNQLNLVFTTSTGRPVADRNLSKQDWAQV